MLLNGLYRLPVKLLVYVTSDHLIFLLPAYEFVIRCSRNGDSPVIWIIPIIFMISSIRVYYYILLQALHIYVILSESELTI